MSDAGAPAISMPIAAAADTLPATLDGLRDSLWARIASALDGQWCPWSLPTLVTVAEDGAPCARVLALRSVDAGARRFVFHTDARSSKVRDIAGDPRVSLLFFDRDDAVQARFDGVAFVHHADPETAAAWRNVSALRRHACSVELEPGEPLDASQRFDRLPAIQDADSGFTNFALIAVEANAIDWLWLGPQDLRRARFAWIGDRWSGSWIVP
jgi:pyridoxamine 5'-phosphate oxidase